MPADYDALYKERDIMDLALEKGRVKLTFRTIEKLKNFRARCYRARSLDRKRSMEVYPVESKLRGKSRYDNLYISVDGLVITFEATEEDLPPGATSMEVGKK